MCLRLPCRSDIFESHINALRKMRVKLIRQEGCSNIVSCKYRHHSDKKDKKDTEKKISNRFPRDILTRLFPDNKGSEYFSANFFRCYVCFITFHTFQINST